jgi:hypothetical protein
LFSFDHTESPKKMSIDMPHSAAVEIEKTGHELAAVADRVEKLLAGLNIKRVVTVDDQHTNPATEKLPDLKIAIRKNADALRQIGLQLTAAGVDISHIDPENAEDLIGVLDREWSDLGDSFQIPALQTVLATNARESEKLSEAEARADMSGPAMLIDVIGPSAAVVRMNRAEWIAGSTGLLADGQPTLVFFDRDFSREQAPEDAGEQLLKDLIGLKQPHVTACLFTKFVEDEQAELEYTRNLTQSLDASSSSLVVIGKFRLENSAGSFPEALRLLLLANEIELLRALTLASIDAAARAARKSIRDLQRYAIVATVASMSEEGAFETDGVTRLALSSFRKRMIEAQKNPTFAVDTLPALRNASAVKLYQESASTGAQLAQILWDDQFEEADYLARVGLPVEVGDLFEIQPLPNSGAPEAGARKYILLTQACDLSVRATGKRSGFTHEFVLHQFKPMPLTSSGKIKDTYGRMQEVGPFVPGSHIWGVDFASRITVPDIAIDATVGTDNGEGHVAVNESLTRVLTAGWQKRRTIMRTEVSRMIAQFQQFEDHLPVAKGTQTTATALQRLGSMAARGSVTNKTGVTAVIDTSALSVRYGIRRIGRVVGPTAVGLVALSASHLGRPAFEKEIVPA